MDNLVNKDLNRFMAFSAIIHLVLLASVFLYAGFIASSQKTVEMPKVMRVDLISTKTLTLKELPPPPAPGEKLIPAEPQDIVNTPKAIEEKKIILPSENIKASSKVPSKDLMKNALNKLSAQAALEKLAAEESQANKSNKKPVGNAVTGAEITKGNSLTGVVKLDYDDYGGRLKNWIEARWKLPLFMAQKRWCSKLRLRIGANGESLATELIKSSGKKDFDETVMEIIADAAPYERPPAHLVNAVAQLGVDVELCSRREDH